MGMGICDDCIKVLTDKCPKKECWENGYSEFELEEVEDMAIDEVITIISNIDKAYRAFTPEEIQALETSLNTMRKYQEIEQILQEPCIIPEGCYPMLKKIREVMGDVDKS